MVIRLTLDVNVWFNNYWSLSRGKTGSAAQRVVAACIAGSCRFGDIQPIISHLMLDTLEGALVRKGFSPRLAEVARDAVEAAAADAVLSIPPVAVIGGGTEAVLDEEDRAVLETAIAGRADMLVTSNMKDFTPGPRANIAAEIIRCSPDGKPDVLLVRDVRLADGLVIASPAASCAWLVDGVAPPGGVLQRFMPPARPF